jgi:hypothetical protein
MPEARDPRTLGNDAAAEFFYKPNYGRVGEDIAIQGVTPSHEYAQIHAKARRHPAQWMSQKRFESVPVERESGPRFLCIGVFTLNGESVGAYGRIAARPLIDQQAQDVAILISECQNLTQ